MILWLQFIICAALILISGYRLSRYADIISEKGIFSPGFMGVFFLAAITSCPEVATSLGSITIVNAPDMAIGDLVGAVIINLCVISTFAFFYKKGPILAGQKKSNILTGLLTILMLGLLIGSISLRAFTGIQPGLFNVGIDSILIGLIYLLGIRAIYNHEAINEKPRAGGSHSKLWIKFSVCALVIIASGFWLAHTGKAIADSNNWNEMYIGLTLMAIATTLPEFVVSLSALRLGSTDMAVGNIMGSNFFNISILALLDIFFRKGEFLNSVSFLNIYPAFAAMLLLTAIVIRMHKRPKQC